MSFKPFIRRLQDPTVVWSWILNGVRMTSGVLLLPLVVNKLSGADQGMFWDFVFIAQLAPVVDFGFAPSIGRFVSYAMAGAVDIEAQGIGSKATGNGPNFQLVWQLLLTTRRIYLGLALVALILAGCAGSLWVGLRINETSQPQVTWVAWAIVVVSTVLEVYFSWWTAFLNGMNEVFYSARMGALANLLKLVLASTLLLAGTGLLALPIATLISSTSLRYAARRRCMQLLRDRPRPKSFETKMLLEKLWPNSWRMGTQILSAYLRNGTPLFICTTFFNLEANAALGFSLTVVGMIQSLSSVWTQVKWPLVGQQLMRGDHVAVHSTLRPRFLMQFATFGLMAFALIIGGPICLGWVSKTKQLLPTPWLVVLLSNSVLELHFTFWTTLLSYENRLPFLWPTVITNGSCLLLAVVLVKFTSLQLGALVLAPLLASSVFNYWYWAMPGAAKLKTSWRSFVFGGASSARPGSYSEA